VNITKKIRKTRIWIIVSLFPILCISLIISNDLTDVEERTSLTISDELIRSGTFEMPYTQSACMVINGMATTKIEWMFESSKHYIAITLEIQYCEGTCGEIIILSDGTKHNDSGVYQVESKGLYQFLFWNKDNDEERTNITYYIIFDPEDQAPLISSFPLHLLSLFSLSGIMILVYKLKRN